MTEMTFGELHCWQRRCAMDLRGQGQYAINTLVDLAPMSLWPIALQSWVVICDVSSNWTNHLHIGVGAGVATPRTGGLFAGWETRTTRYHRWRNFRGEEAWELDERWAASMGR